MPFINMSLLNTKGKMLNVVFEIPPSTSDLVQTAMERAKGLMARETLSAITSALNYAHELKHLTDDEMRNAMKEQPKK